MKLLLVNTPIDVPGILGKFSRIYDDLKMVPTGIAYLAAFVRQAGIEVRILDQYAECLPLDHISQRIAEFAPDLIGYSATTPNYFAAITMLREVRKRHPGIKTVMGGQHPSIFAEVTLGNAEVDFVIRDEGEHSLLALCRAIGSGSSDYAGIPGLSYKTTAGVIMHNEKTAQVDVNALPFPAYDLLPMRLYSSPSYTKFATPVYQMIASRGCPYHCTYCINAELNIAAKYRRRQVDSVLDEMELLVNQYGARQVQFWDPIFPLGHAHAQEFCDKLMERGLHKKIVWNSTTRAETLRPETIKLLAQAGCKGLGFGIESGVPELLDSVKKKFDFDKVRDICRLARREGMVVTGAFILGFPGETRAMSRQTIDFAKSLDIHYAQFSIMVPYPGTPLYRELEAKGEIQPADEKDFSRFNQSIGLTENKPIFIPKGRTEAELKNLQRQAYTEFYFRPIMVWRHLPHLRRDTLLGALRSFVAVGRLMAQRLKNMLSTKSSFESGVQP